MWATIVKPFAWLLLWLYEVTSNYGIAVILFAFVVNLVLAPFMAKSKKSMMRTSRLQPKIQEIQRRHEGNPEKMNKAMSELYREEKINPASGCIWTLIPFPILIALYSVIRQPITRMMGLSSDVVTALQEYFTSAGLYEAPARASAYGEITLTQLAHEHWADLQAAIGPQIEGLRNIDYSFLGLNLGDFPKWNFFTSCDWSSVHSWLPALGLFLIPFISAFLSWLSMKVSNMTNPSVDPNAQAQMKSMNLMMPLMSIWICFIMPAALGIYWIANSVLGMGRDYLLTKIFKAQLDKEDADKIAARSAREKELAEKHAKTEKLKAEGKTEVNTNTRKKKLQQQNKQSNEERRKAAERAEREERRARLGIEIEKNDSQVGDRRFARGRAYEADRFKNRKQDAENNTNVNED